MSKGRHQRVKDSVWLAAAVWILSLAAAVLSALTSDARYLRLAVVIALAAALLQALVAARAPRHTDVRALRRQVAGLRSDLAIRPAPLVEVVVVPSSGRSLSRPTSVNGSAYLDRTDGRRLVLDLVALEEATEAARR
ncbi:MAG: hypothetical protein QOC60_567 [Frankiaceae bacterium]|nr:hypothetical protein [Frankiaceae bacterium]